MFAVVQSSVMELKKTTPVLCRVQGGLFIPYSVNPLWAVVLFLLYLFSFQKSIQYM